MTTNAHQIRHNHGNKTKKKKSQFTKFALRCTFIYAQYLSFTKTSSYIFNYLFRALYYTVYTNLLRCSQYVRTRVLTLDNLLYV